MIQIIRKLTALLLTLALVYSMSSAPILAAETATEGLSTASSIGFRKGKTLHILAVGNSFSVDGLHYLYYMARSAGYHVVIGELYLAKCSLETHWNNANENKNSYTYYKISDDTNGAWCRKENISMGQAVQDEVWDVVTLQQSSAISGVPSSYYQSISWTCDTDETSGVNLLAAILSEWTESEWKPRKFFSKVKKEQIITCDADATRNIMTFPLNATAKTDLSYQTSNPAVATVNENGEVTLIGNGKTTITITAAASDRYESATTKVTVTSRLTSYMALLTQHLRAQYQDSYGESAARQLKFGWHMTWAYTDGLRGGNTGKNFCDNYRKYYKGSQTTMYHAITDTLESTVQTSGLFSFCVPIGTALQNARSSYAGDRLNRDGVHLSYDLGRYIAAMTCAASLGLNPSEITYRPTGSDAVSKLDLDMIRTSVTNAEQTPWTVTKSSYHTAPALKRTVLKRLHNTRNGISLTWKKVDNATGYYIYRKAGNGNYSLVKNVTNGATTSCTDTEVKSKSDTSDPDYTYSIKAYSGKLITAERSNLLVLTRLVAPSKVRVSNVSNGIKLTWKKVDHATAYRVYRKTGDGFRTCIKTLMGSRTLRYTDTAVKSQNGKTYSYDVVACSKLGEGVPSSAKTVKRLKAVTVKSLKKYGTALKLT